MQIECFFPSTEGGLSSSWRGYARDLPRWWLIECVEGSAATWTKVGF